MKTSLLVFPALVLMSGFCLGQTAAAPSPSIGGPAQFPAFSPMPAIRQHVPPAVSSEVDKVPPNQPETRSASWEKRALGNIAKSSTEAGSIEVVFDGDSITDFWQSRGRKIWAEALAKYQPFDFGISGDTTQNLLWRLAHGQAAGLHPKVILLMIGTNNMRYKNTPQEIADGVAEIINQYRKVCPDAVIVLQAIFPRAESPTDPYRLKVNATNPLLAKLADGTKVIYLDFGAKFLTADGTLTKDIMPDLLHPSEKGYQIWADAISPVLEKYAGGQAAQ